MLIAGPLTRLLLGYLSLSLVAVFAARLEGMVQQKDGPAAVSFKARYAVLDQGFLTFHLDQSQEQAGKAPKSKTASLVMCRLPPTAC